MKELVIIETKFIIGYAKMIMQNNERSDSVKLYKFRFR